MLQPALALPQQDKQERAASAHTRGPLLTVGSLLRCWGSCSCSALPHTPRTCLLLPPLHPPSLPQNTHVLHRSTLSPLAHLAACLAHERQQAAASGCTFCVPHCTTSPLYSTRAPAPAPHVSAPSPEVSKGAVGLPEAAAAARGGRCVACTCCAAPTAPAPAAPAAPAPPCAAGCACWCITTPSAASASVSKLESACRASCSASSSRWRAPALLKMAHSAPASPAAATQRHAAPRRPLLRREDVWADPICARGGCAGCDRARL